MRSEVEKGKGRFSTPRLTLLALLLACALVLGLAERAVPLESALPGLRLGLPNAALLLALYLFPFPEALTLVMLKCALLALLAGSFTSFAYSLTGSLLSLCVMTPLVRFARWKISPVGVSVAGAVCHNIGQLLCASVLMGTFLFPCLPLLLVSGAASGAAVGLAAAYTLPKVERITNNRFQNLSGRTVFAPAAIYPVQGRHKVCPVFPRFSARRGHRDLHWLNIIRYLRKRVVL